MEPSTVNKIDSFLQDVQYRSLMINSASFNVRLMKDRRTRLPFLDTQTGIAQKPCDNLVRSNHRMPGIKFGQIYLYPAQRWCRKKRSYISLAEQAKQDVAKISETAVITNEMPPATISTEDNSPFDGKASIQSDIFYYEEPSYMEDEEDEPDNDEDDTYSTRSSKRRRKVPRSKGNTKISRGRRRREPSNYKIITDADDDNPGKPYECSLCGARYKTRQGLSYHLSHTHRNNNSNSTASNNNPPNITVARPMTMVEQSHGSNVNMMHSPLFPQPDMQNDYYQQILQRPYQAIQQPVPTSDTAPEFQDNYLGPVRPHETNAPDMQTPEDNIQKVPLIEKKVSDEPASSHIQTMEQTFESPPQSSKRDKRATPNQYCDFCLGTAEYNNKTGQADEMVSCADCGRSGHFVCLQFTANMVISVKQYPWQCLECKCCTLCGTSENDDKLLFCDDCDRGYHLYCLETPLSEPPEGEWSCKLCVRQFHESC